MSNNNPKPDFTATFSLGTFTVNVPSDVHNADVNPSENNVIKTNGTYNVPNDKSGWNSFSVNVTPTITPNVADLMITNDVYDYVKEHHDGMLILPGNDPTIIEETMFDTQGKDYATSVIIDLNFLDKELKIDPAHQKLRLSEDEEDFEIYDYEKDGDYDVRVKPKPEPEPEPTKKSRFITFKSNTRDIIEDDPTYRNIGSFTIVAPILNSIVLPAGTYTFNIGIYNNENNTDYLGVKTITFTPSVPSSLSKTVEIDTIQNNVTTLYLPQNDGEKNIMPVLSSNTSNRRVTVNGSGFYLGNDLYKLFDNNNNTYFPNMNSNNNYFIIEWNDGPQVINKVIVDCYYSRGSYTFRFNISGSNDNENYTQLYDGLCNTGGNWKTFVLLLDNNMNDAYTYYKIYSYTTSGNSADNTSRINNMKFIQYGEYQYYDSFTIVNKTASDLGTPIIQSYNNNNQTVSVSTSNTNIQSNFTGNITVPLESITTEINSNGTTTITPNNNYYGIKRVDLTTRVLPNLYTQPTITSSGNYSLPSGYDGFASPITVNIQPTLKYVTKWRLTLTYKNGSDVSTVYQERNTSYMSNYSSNHSVSLSTGTSSYKYFAVWANETSFAFYIWNSNSSVGGGGSTSVELPKGRYDNTYFSSASGNPFDTQGYSCVLQSVTLYLLDSNSNALWTYTATVPAQTYAPHLFSGSTTIEREDVEISFTS